MSKISDIAGVVTDFSIGLLSGTGDRILRFIGNNFTGSLVWNLTANRTLRLPDKSGTLLVLGDGTYSSIVSVSTTKNLNASDANTYQDCSNSSAITITVLADATLNFPVGTEIEIAQNGTGSVTVVADTGVVIRRGGSTVTTNHILIGQYYAAIIKKISANTWIIYGDLQ